MSVEARYYKTHTLHKGATFTLEFRLRTGEGADAPVYDLTGKVVAINIRENEESEDRLLRYVSGTDPELVIDADDIITLTIPNTVTATIPYDTLFFTVDVEANSRVDRWIYGEIPTKAG